MDYNWSATIIMLPSIDSVNHKSGLNWLFLFCFFHQIFVLDVLCAHNGPVSCAAPSPGVVRNTPPPKTSSLVLSNVTHLLIWFDFFTLLGWRMCTGSVWDVSLPFLSHRQKGGRRCSVTPIVDPSPGTLDSSSHCDFLHRNVWWLTWPPPPNYFSSLFD